MDKLKTLKALLGITGNEKDALLNFALSNVEEMVKNYCNIKAIPKGLQNTVIRMAMDLYRNEQPGGDIVPVAVKSISAGDTSTSFGAVESDFSQSVLKNYKAQLNRYRRVDFGGRNAQKGS